VCDHTHDLYVKVHNKTLAYTDFTKYVAISKTQLMSRTGIKDSFIQFYFTTFLQLF